MENGQEVHHTIPDWTYLSQDSVSFSNKDLSDVVYIADFFFMSCPSICPKVMREMLRLHDEFKDNPNVKLVSFTLDPKRDTPARLKLYAENIEADTDKWIFLHTDEDIYDLANKYFVVAYADEEAPGGFDHSGKILLIDKDGHVRSFSEGTDPKETQKMIRDTKTLLASYANKK